MAFVLWIVSAIVSTCYTFTWDIKMDWGLFEGKYKLRSELIYGHKVRFKGHPSHTQWKAHCRFVGVMVDVLA